MICHEDFMMWIDCNPSRVGPGHVPGRLAIAGRVGPAYSLQSSFFVSFVHFEVQ